MVERGGRVIAKVTPNVKAETVFPIIHEFVMPQKENGYQHRRIKHAEKVCVMGDVHTQMIATRPVFMENLRFPLLFFA
ncbi:MAG TPA: hypothetical protein VMH85_05450 [Terriglobales bacterium]|nr:hypothetical protein [Terriglobales bacterium]